MKKVGFAILCLFIGLFYIENAAAGKNVLILSSTSEEGAKKIGTYSKFFEGVEETLKGNNITLQYFYKDLDNAPNDGVRETMAKEAIEEIKQKKPDVLIATGDNALKYFSVNIDGIPSVFGYVYGNINDLGLPKPHITGVTRRSYAPDIWGLANKLIGAKTVAMLSKDSLPMQGIRKVLSQKADGLEKLSGVRFLDMYLVDTFADWQAKVKEFPADFIYMAETSRLSKEDGTETTRAETVKWTVANSKVPVVAAVGEDVDAGALYTILTSEKAWGAQVGALVLKIVGGTPAAEIPIETVSKGALIINSKTALQYKIDIPYDILSIAERIVE